MERGFYNDDFEQLIRQKADQYKMFPSDNVWKGVHRSMHPRRRWYWLGFLLFLAGIGYYGAVQLMSRAVKKTVAQSNADTRHLITNNTSENRAIIVPFQVPDRSGRSARYSSLTGTTTNDQSASPKSSEVALPDQNTVVPAPAAFITTPVIGLHSGSLRKTSGFALKPTGNTTTIEEQPKNNTLTGLAEEISSGDTEETYLDESPVINAAGQSKKPVRDEGRIEDAKRINWLQENAVYELAPPPMQRVSWSLTFSPTINYRRFTSSSPVNTPGGIKDVPAAIEGKPDELVNHHPALGLEAGTHILYAINKSLRLKAGLQFNYSRYDIQAYENRIADKAVIELQNSQGTVHPGPITKYSRLRNYGGDEPKELHNDYFQLSAPVGLELRVLGNNKLELNIAGTLQPTYLFNRNLYLITNDFKNYTREPSLIRKWNVNTGAEIFLAYKTKGVKWQLGPQFRYQLFSSYIKEYPIRENLMEYGIKLGVTKTIR